MAAKEGQILVCSHCGLEVKVLKNGATPICCGEPMQEKK